LEEILSIYFSISSSDCPYLEEDRKREIRERETERGE
jgi:hypothetical protein